MSSPKVIRSPHWTSGGSGVTNFARGELPVYSAAVKEYGSDKLAISSVPMIGMGCPNLLSLHFIGEPHSLSPFWRLWETIKLDHEFDRQVAKS